MIAGVLGICEASIPTGEEYCISSGMIDEDQKWCGGRDLNSRFVHGLIKQPQCITTEPGPQPGTFDLAWQPPQSAKPKLMVLAIPSCSDYSRPLWVKQIHFVSLFIFSGAIYKISVTKTSDFGHRAEISISLLCSVLAKGITT